MTAHLNDKNSHNFIIDVVDNSIVIGKTTKICNVLSAF